MLIASIVMVIIMIVIVYGVWFRNWGEKHYKIYKRYLPLSNKLGPRNETDYVSLQKAVVVIGLLGAITILILNVIIYLIS